MREKRLNSYLPPFVLFAIIPVFWIITLSVNFLVDSAILLVIGFILYKKLDFSLYKKSIVKVLISGFVSCFMGVIFLYLINLLISALNSLFNAELLTKINSAVNQPHFDCAFGLVYVISGIVVAAVFIFVFNYFFSFKKTDFTKKQKITASVVFSIFNAPYFFLLPDEFFDFANAYINLYDFVII